MLVLSVCKCIVVEKGAVFSLISIWLHIRRAEYMCTVRL